MSTGLEAYGTFSDAEGSFIVSNPVTPRPWLNYLGNRRLAAFISQNAGGLLWLHEPATRRITRYHFLAAPGDRPGFYLYVRNRKTGNVWNPHFAPTCMPLDSYACHHSPGVTSFVGIKDSIRVRLSLGVATNHDVLLWHVEVENQGEQVTELELSSYMEFGLLEFLREALGWCYLKSHFSLRFDPTINGIRYHYHVFEAPATPAMIFACTQEVSHFDCSRDAFIGRVGSLENPEVLRPGRDLTGSELPDGGHACAALAVDLVLAPGEKREIGYVFALAEDWTETEDSIRTFSTAEQVRAGLNEIGAQWDERLAAFQVQTGDASVDHFVNVWNPYNAFVTLEHCRIISTDHMGTDGLRFRDTSQDALAVIPLDPTLAEEKLGLILEQQKADGDGCFAFYPHTNKPTSDAPHRSDNMVWPVFSYKALIAETGNWDLLEKQIPFRDGPRTCVYDHLKTGLELIWSRRGPHGLPKMLHADWNDGLALFQDPDAESVMLGFQLACALRDLSELAKKSGRSEDAASWISRYEAISAALNRDEVWDGHWYRRLILSNGKPVGSRFNAQGRIYLDVQPWALLSGVGEVAGRGKQAMQSVYERLLSPFGLAIVEPAYRGFPDPGDPPVGSGPGTNENGGVFCHANTWAIIAECLLGHGNRAFDYYRRLLPEEVIRQIGADLYEREPYVYVSSLWGPESSSPGRAGISWLTGTASWMYLAITQYILGVRPTLEGLQIAPCLPNSMKEVKMRRTYRGALLDLHLINTQGDKREVRLDGEIVRNGILPDLQPGVIHQVECFC